MRQSVKVFFNNLLRKKSSKKIPRRRTLGIKPMNDVDVPEITEFSHFIECEIAPDICPMLWEELTVDFEDKDRRHCEYCDKYVYKADNVHMINELESKNVCMAISDILLEKINGKIDEQRYKNLEDRLAVSKLFLVYKKYEPYFFEEMKSKQLTYEEQLKSVIVNLLEGEEYQVKKMIELMIKKGVDLEFIFSEILPRVVDEEFGQFVFGKISGINWKRK